MTGLRVVVIGATGNIGTSVVSALAHDDEVASIVGVARRRPDWEAPKTTWVQADVADDDLASLVRRADAVVHLAWLLQPTHNPLLTWKVNVGGTVRLLESLGRAPVQALVYLSSVAAYSPGPKDRPVDEDWPTDGWPGASYAREKAYLERVLDSFELRHPDVRVVRLRPGFVLKRSAASHQRRLFAGPLFPRQLARPGAVPFVPGLPGLLFQMVHTDDVAEAVRRTLRSTVRGPFNLAADPVVDANLLADCLEARVVPVPIKPARAVLSVAWRAHLVPASPGLFDALLHLAVMSTHRARAELDWLPKVTADDALREALAGVRTGAGFETPPLAARVPGGRWRELRTGVGQRP